jgi:hypothetical protein
VDRVRAEVPRFAQDDRETGAKEAEEEVALRAAASLSGLYVRFVVKKHGAQGTHVPGKSAEGVVCAEQRVVQEG